MSPLPLVLLDVDTHTDPALLRDYAEMLSVESARTIGLPTPLGFGVSFSARVGTNRTKAPGEIGCYFVSHPDVADALGYHEIDEHGSPLIKCFPALDDLGSEGQTPSHEVNEVAGNPMGGRLFARPGTSVLDCGEASDPVENSFWIYTCTSGRKLRYSNFVTPAYFEPPTDPVKLDWLSLVTTPGQILDGGYQIHYDPATRAWTQETNGELRGYRKALASMGVNKLSKFRRADEARMARWSKRLEELSRG